MTKIVISSSIFLHSKIFPATKIDVNANELIHTTNDYRKSLNLSELAINPRLTQAATNKANDILSNDYFDHTAPNGKRFSQWIKDVNYDYFYVGENLAIDFTSNEDLFQAWLDSPTHKDNIIKPQYQEIGIATLNGEFKNRQTMVAVQLFGTRVLGAQEASYPAPPSFTQDYFIPTSLLEKIFSFKTLEKIDLWNNYILIIFLGLALIIYNPRRPKSQINIKQPITNRYSAKIFRE